MTRAEIRREAALRSSTALDIALRLSTDRRLVRKIARLLLHLGAGPMEHGHSMTAPLGISRPAKAAGFTALRMNAHEPA